MKEFSPQISNLIQKNDRSEVMIVKTRSYPIEIMMLEAIVRRFPPHNPRKVEFKEKLMRKRAGYKGELTLDYYMSQIDHSNFMILQDLRIPHNGTHFQIDTLLISSTFILIIESKNYAGILEFYPEFNQLIRTLNGVQEAFPDPVIQTKIQASQLKSFLSKNHQFTLPPIKFLVAMSNSQAIIKNPTNNKEVSQKVCRTSSIAFRIKPLEEEYKNPTLSKKEIKKIVKLLLNSHTPFIPHLASMNLPLEDMIQGVECPQCNEFHMDRIHGTWVCKHCGHVSKEAHIPAIKDFFLLYGFKISNKQLRRFLLINSVYTGNRILQALDLLTTGSTKDRIYSPPKNFFE
jgi:hypothetical protein